MHHQFGAVCGNILFSFLNTFSVQSMAITTRSMNQLEDNQPREEEVAPPPTNQVLSTQRVLETMRELVGQNQQILQLMLTAQGGAQPGPQVRGAPPLGCQGTPHMGAPHPGATFGAHLGAPLGAQHGRAPHEGLPPPPPPAPASQGGDPHLQEDEGENQSMGHGNHFQDNRTSQSMGREKLEKYKIN